MINDQNQNLHRMTRFGFSFNAAITPLPVNSKPQGWFSPTPWDVCGGEPKARCQMASSSGTFLISAFFSSSSSGTGRTNSTPVICLM